MSSKAIKLRSGTEIISATTEYGREITHDDNGWEQLWVYRNTMGIVSIVGAGSFESAYEVAMDLLPPIDESEVHEAYGYDTEEELEAAAVDGDYPTLCDGYQYQFNATGTGIVSTDLNGESLERLTVDLLRRLKINLQIRRY